MLAAPLPLLAGRSGPRQSSNRISVDARNDSGLPFRPSDIGTVGVFDVDWLVQPQFAPMLDLFAASPGAFTGVRTFGIFTAGKPDDYLPTSGGAVWTSLAEPIDFTVPFAALDALISRGLTPFISLGFFPPAISHSPVMPPIHWTDWQTLVKSFLVALAGDSRYGEDRMRTWWFEAWNEPNEGRFWTGDQHDYFDCYRATSRAISETGLAIRFGGPAIAYKPQISPDDGAPWMERFLQFIASDPSLQCDFVSLHRKGTVGSDPPDPIRLYDASRETRDLMRLIDEQRFSGIPIVNDEADEKVGFEVPYAPRMTQVNASWLAATTAIQAHLTATSTKTATRFMAAADNANLQLVQAPFDGRRSLVTYVLADSDELVKLPAFAFYELLRLLDGDQCPVRQGAESLFPNTGFYHLATVSKNQFGSLFTWYPEPNISPRGTTVVEVEVENIPWDSINIAVFQIDETHSNAYTAAGGSAENPFPTPKRDKIGAIRIAEEIQLAGPIERRATPERGVWRTGLTFAPYQTTLIWITPWSNAIPEAPTEIDVEPLTDRTHIRWTPSKDAAFYSYELCRVDPAGNRTQISPEPLRSARWTDDPVATDVRYEVRVTTTSGMTSAAISSANR